VKHQGASILVIDDDEAMREYAGFVLEKSGYSVFLAKDGNEGMSIVATHAPRLIITDLVMPEREGLETIREIKAKFPACGIIAMSGAANSDAYLSMAQCLGAHTVIQKPFTRKQLETAVKQVLTGSEGDGPSAGGGS
jgi:CheY-like chemotaxis protein